MNCYYYKSQKDIKDLNFRLVLKKITKKTATLIIKKKIIINLLFLILKNNFSILIKSKD